MICPSCQHPTVAGKFCAECGQPLPPPTGGNSGDIVATRSTVIAGSNVLGDAAIAALSPLVKCPLCGRKNKPFDTFECSHCGRDHVCMSHQDVETFWCINCVREAKAEAERLQGYINAGMWIKALNSTQDASKRAEIMRAACPKRAMRITGGGIDFGEFMQVPAGEFRYGNDKQVLSSPEFWLGKTVVTTAQFLAFARATGFKGNDHWGSKNDAWLKSHLNYPAVYVDWHEANAFFVWASKITGQHLRLPHEQEWEKAARGIDGRTYPWGEAAPSAALANYDKDWSIDNLAAVDAYSPQGDSPYGCVQMAGNIWEWCDNKYNIEEDWRVLRGGAFNDLARNVRCAFRHSFYPSYHIVNFGFRVAVARLPSL